MSELVWHDYPLNCPLSSTRLSKDQKKASGVILNTGETIDANVVIINADLTYAYNNLLQRSRCAQSLAKRHASRSSISFFWSLDTSFPALESYNVFLAEEYRRGFDGYAHSMAEKSNTRSSGTRV